MRSIINLNANWMFNKQMEIPQNFPNNWQTVNLPHTWNAEDGQDGGNDYFRGTCQYVKIIEKATLVNATCYYLEINGANSSADVFINGKHLAHHDGGYSIWRLNITEELKTDALLVISVDNSPNDTVYPQMADFTFYGGLYRNINLICVNESHFSLDYFGSPGIKVTPKIIGEDASVNIETWVTNKKAGQKLRYIITSRCGCKNWSIETEENHAAICIPNVHLWHGVKDPYLYTATVELIENDIVIDSIKTPFGCRSFEIDANRGFILNGKEYPLRGVCRHQDRWGIGNALLPEHHEEDIALIMETGSNTVRLAHYQHDQYFYDLCDEKGLVVWAEIPYISKQLPKARGNTISQMKELVIQSYNHPSIVVWGISNEISMSGEKDADLIANHRILNDLCHELDATRLTVVAVVSMCPIDAEYIKIPDVISYNHYFGWYGGETSMNGPWFDEFHAKNPNIPIGCSEYGCEALNWHTSAPMQGDYTEEYQAYYHEELIKQLYTRPYIWATHVWNMFDFGADARAEGGENGQNHKGLVTFDRKYKKDSFYAYKAWLSDEPFVHICGKRYIDRVEDITKVTVYSNQPEVELFANGVSMGKKTAADHFFRFEVPNAGQTQLVAKAGECCDEGKIVKVNQPNESYRLLDKSAVLNWFDITEVNGYLSLNSKISDIMATLRGKLLLVCLLKKFKKSAKSSNASGAFELTEAAKKMLGGFSILRMTSLAAMMDVTFTKEELLKLNNKLNKIKMKSK